MKNVIFILSLFYFQNSFAAELGKMAISGQGCEEPKKDISFLKAPPGELRYEVPLHFKLIKTNANSLERKACNISIPIKLKKNEKIQVSKFTQNVKVSHSKETSVKAELSLFFAGVKKPKPFELELKTGDSMPLLETFWREDSVYLESACGKDVILRGNLSAFANGLTEATADAGELLFSVKSLECKK